jgi:hypothetical protein
MQRRGRMIDWRLAALFAFAAMGVGGSLRAQPYPDPNEVVVSPWMAPGPRQPPQGFQPPPPECCPLRPQLYYQLEFMMFGRSPGSSRTLVVDEHTGAPLFTSGDLSLGFPGGARMLVGMRFHPRAAIEFTYFGVRDWDGQDTIFGDNNLSLPPDLGPATLDFQDADQMSFSLDSKFHNFELNGLWSYTPTISLLAGIRAIELEEAFSLVSTDSDSGSSNYNVTASNELFGAQVGAMYKRQNPIFGWETFGKTGLYGNNAGQRTFLGDFNNTFVLRDYDVSETTAAFEGEWGVNGTMKFGDLSLRVGYLFMAFSNMATAVDNLDFTDTPTSSTGIDASDTVFIHALTAGAELRW